MTITTTDIDCAAYLMAEGADLVALETMECSGRHLFRLCGERVEECVEDYVLGNAMVRVEPFLDARRALLGRLRHSRRGR